MSNDTIIDSGIERSGYPLAKDFSDQRSGESLLKQFWRHKFLIAACVLLAGGVGYWQHQKKPATYAASTQLMIRSDKPLSVDNGSGVVAGGLPDTSVLSTLVRSDVIATVAAADSEMTALQAGSVGSVAGRIRGGIGFSVSAGSKGSDRVIANLSYSGGDPDFCVAAVNSTARAIENFFEKEREQSLTGFALLIDRAQNKLLPELADLESGYREFRNEAPLTWSADGKTVNPHRQRQVELVLRQAELRVQRRNLDADYRLIKSTWNDEKDITVVVELIKQIGGSYASEAGSAAQAVATTEENGLSGLLARQKLDNQLHADTQIRDLELEQIRVEESLVPLEVELQTLTSTYGDEHPAVNSIRSRVLATRNKLNDLAGERQRRIQQLRFENERVLQQRLASQSNESAGPSLQDVVQEKQKKFVTGFCNAIKHRIDLIEKEIADTKIEAAEEKSMADALAQAESEDASYKRQIESVQGILFQLEDQMAGLNVSSINEGVSVDLLMASVNPRLTGPNLGRDLSTALMIGLAAGCGLAFLMESQSRTFRSSDQISEELKLPIVAHIPLDEDAGSIKKSKAEGAQRDMHSNLGTIHRPGSATTEAVRCARTTLLFDASTTGNKVYQITSPLPGDGKSTIAANLACSLAQSGNRTLLIDLDLRSPRLTGRFGLAEQHGFTNLLNGECDPVAATYQTPMPRLDVVPSGSIPANPAEALLLPETREALAWYRDQYDFVIIDSPPLLLVTDPAITTQYVDSVILAMRIIRKCKPNTKESVNILRSAKAKILGIVVNKVDEVTPGSYYQMGTEGSYGRVGYGYGKKYRDQVRSKSGGKEYSVTGRRHQLHEDTAEEVSA